jgi:signal transduction histidine kinase
MRIESSIRSRYVLLGLGATGLVLLLWPLTASGLLEYKTFMSHGHCYLWRPNLILLHVTSDSLITIAYYTIPFTLLYLVRKRKDLPFNWMFVAFGVFIIACGTTHLLEIVTVWTPVYWLSGVVKAITALASVTTAVALVKLAPVILMIPGVQELKAAKEQLELEVAERKVTQANLQEARDQLERRVEERTTDLAKANAELEQASRLKDQFLAMLSHELRTPLTAIYGWIHMLQSEALDEKTVTRALGVMERNVRAQARLVDDLLNVSRIVTGKLKIEPEWTNARRMIETAVESIRPATDAKAICVETRIDPTVSAIYADPARIQQVLWNLLTNAVKFTPQSGLVSLVLIQTSGTIQISVADTGEGIEPDFLPHVFERFSQADASPSRKHGGLGLGLSISRQLVELHGGTIAVSSAGRDKGATFKVTLPIPAVRLDDTEKLVSEGRTIVGLRVMIVEDDPDTREMIIEALHRHGAAVLAASSGAEALRILQENSPDIVVSDIGMPGMDGYDLLNRIRVDVMGDVRSVPAIALTAHASAEDKEKARRAGFADHIAKPISISELVYSIARVARNQ